MASSIGHGVSAIAFSALLPKALRTPLIVTIGIFLSICPDFDVFGYYAGIPYESFWGHRGFTHSIVFGCALGTLVSILFYRKYHKRNQRLILAIYFSVCTFSHGLIDAMTNGGKGIAILSPFNNDRLFFPWRPIQVSPMSIKRFISEWGLEVLASEAIWIGIPSLVFYLCVRLIRR